MSLKLDFTLKLISDAELSSGFGSELVNALVPRATDGKPVIPSTHIKGLMKQTVIDAKNSLEGSDSIYLDTLMQKAFGSPGSTSRIESLFYVSNCYCGSKWTIRTISRTSLNENGTAKETSLRTTEAISAGTIFKGFISFPAEPEKELDLLIRFALLSVMEVGGGRNRGSGACVVTIDQEEEENSKDSKDSGHVENESLPQQPGTLLLELLNLARASDKSESSDNLIQHSQDIVVSGDPQKRVALKLTFTAEGQLCVPELPIVGTNVIRSGFSIPASAVQGMILTRINALDSNVADSCYKSENFRAWPMQPLPLIESVAAALDSTEEYCVFPMRASATHKISKLPFDNDKYSFSDEIIEPYEWSKTPKNSPLKSADGILVQTENGVMLWRSGDMARYISAHGVHNGDVQQDSSGKALDSGKRGLFTVESISVRKFIGLVYMPEDAANLLMESLKSNSVVQIGKARSVRGSGSLKAEIIKKVSFRFPKSAKSSETSKIAQAIKEQDSDIAAFIVQSPVQIDMAVTKGNINQVLADVVASAGWGKVEEASGSTQILFGWSRHNNGRQKAQLVIAPGSVFRLEKVPDDLENLLVKGIGKGRERGYGAVLPHPGIATERCSGLPEIITIKSSDRSGEIGWNLWEMSKKSGLMPSQIAQLQSILGEYKTDKEAKKSALDYIERQRTGRPAKIWDRWKTVIEDVKDEIYKDPVQALKALKVWHDLAVANEGKGGN